MVATGRVELVWEGWYLWEPAYKLENGDPEPLVKWSSTVALEAEEEEARRVVVVVVVGVVGRTGPTLDGAWFGISVGYGPACPE